jgi:hypothetical protein
MGGNALSCTSVRLTKKNYDALASNCVSRLKATFPQGRVAAIESYFSKADHGDLDLLLTTDGYDPVKAARALDATEVVRNGPVTSVGVKVRPELDAIDGNVFQVDLIFIPAQAFDYATGYFSFNDLGNLVGRTAHSAGLAHKHDGLWYYVRDGDYKFRELVLTRDYDTALKFLGYDVERFRQGFDTLEDIFWYVARSAFFNRDIFLLENRNAQSRIRDKKRRTYMEFLKFCEAHPELPAFKYPKSKKDWLPRIAEHFPHFQAEYDRALADLERQRAVKDKFNGKWVSKVTGLQGPELGGLMKRFKESFETPEALQAFVLSHSLLDIEVRLKRLQASSAPV